jgi:hypothetical protein
LIKRSRIRAGAIVCPTLGVVHVASKDSKMEVDVRTYVKEDYKKIF